MSPKFWLILNFNNDKGTEIIEFLTKEELNIAISDLGTEDLVGLEVISGFTLTKRSL